MKQLLALAVLSFIFLVVGKTMKPLQNFNKN
jgi:hypothetical protein